MIAVITKMEMNTAKQKLNYMVVKYLEVLVPRLHTW